MNQDVVAFFVCVIIGINGLSEAKCTSRGKFPNNAVSNCKGYTMCLSGGGDVYVEYDLDCPPNFIYSHIDSQCTNITSYQCLPDYNCSNSGNFAAPMDDCMKYVACVEDLDNTFTARIVTCPENMIYKVDIGACVNGTVEMCKIISETVSEDVNVTVGFSISNNAAFIKKSAVILIVTLNFLVNH